MRIDLGDHKALNGQTVRVWIEPNNPAYRGGAVRDTGFLFIAPTTPGNADTSIPALRLENVSEDLNRLNDAVGYELGRKLWAERAQYDRKPYYMAYDHHRFGRLYFEPIAVHAGIMGSSRPDSRYPREQIAFEEDVAQEHLRALFLHERMEMRAARVPGSPDIAEAIAYGEKMSGVVMLTRADYAAEVDWDFDDRLAAVMMGATGRTPLTERSDIERYDTLSALAMRPKRHSVDDKTPEYARWFEYDGTPRLEPLTSEQLAEVLREDYGLPTPEATEQSHLHAIPTADWAWFREKRLGRMALPVTVLHELIRHEERVTEIDRQWAEQARSAGDFCVAMPASPLKVLAVIFDKLSRLGEGDPDLLARAQAAITHMQDPDNGLAVETDEYTAWLAEDWKHFSLRLSARDSELEPERETTDVSEPHPTEDFESPSM